MHDQKKIRKDPSVRYYRRQLINKQEVVFFKYVNEEDKQWHKFDGIIEDTLEYQLKFIDVDQPVNKATILFFYKPDAEEAVNQTVTITQEVADKKLTAPRKYSERLKNYGKVLLEYKKARQTIEITLRSGHILIGKIHSFGIFSIRLTIAKYTRIIIQRSNIYSIAKEGSSDKKDPIALKPQQEVINVEPQQQCSKCGELKELNQYHKGKKQCKNCVRQYQKEYRARKRLAK